MGTSHLCVDGLEILRSSTY